MGKVKQCKANATEIKSATFAFDCIICKEWQPIDVSEWGSNRFPICDKCIDDLREVIASKRAKIKQSTFEIKLNAEDY